MNKNHTSFSALSSKMNKRYFDAVQTVEQGRFKVPCANGDADKIRSANYETVLKLRIFFWFTPQLFSRSEHSLRKLIDAL
jgi:hypothetical protein